MLSHDLALLHYSAHPKKLEISWLSSGWEAGEHRRVSENTRAELRWFG